MQKTQLRPGSMTYPFRAYLAPNYRTPELQARIDKYAESALDAATLADCRDLGLRFLPSEALVVARNMSKTSSKAVRDFILAAFVIDLGHALIDTYYEELKNLYQNAMTDQAEVQARIQGILANITGMNFFSTTENAGRRVNAGVTLDWLQAPEKTLQKIVEEAKALTDAGNAQNNDDGVWDTQNRLAYRQRTTGTNMAGGTTFSIGGKKYRALKLEYASLAAIAGAGGAVYPITLAKRHELSITSDQPDKGTVNQMGNVGLNLCADTAFFKVLAAIREQEIRIQDFSDHLISRVIQPLTQRSYVNITQAEVSEAVSDFANLKFEETNAIDLQSIGVQAAILSVPRDDLQREAVMDNTMLKKRLKESEQGARRTIGFQEYSILMAKVASVLRLCRQLQKEVDSVASIGDRTIALSKLSSLSEYYAPSCGPGQQVLWFTDNPDRPGAMPVRPYILEPSSGRQVKNPLARYPICTPIMGTAGNRYKLTGTAMPPVKAYQNQAGGVMATFGQRKRAAPAKKKATATKKKATGTKKRTYKQSQVISKTMVAKLPKEQLVNHTFELLRAANVLKV